MKPQTRRIVALFRPYRGRLAGVLGLIVVGAALTMISPFLLREVIDDAIPGRDTTLLAWLVAGMVAIAIAAGALTVVQTYVSTVIGQRVMHDLRTAVYRHLQRMSLAFFTRTRTGEVQSRIASDIGGVQQVVTETATTVVQNATLVFATVVAMVVLDWRLAAFTFVVLPLFVWITRQVGDERKRITTRRQRRMADMSALVVESLSVSGMLLGKTMGRSAELADRFETESERVAHFEVQSRMAGRWRMSAVHTSMAILPALVYLFAGLAIAGGSTNITIGTVVAFTTLQARIMHPIGSLLNMRVDVRASRALFERIFEYLDLPVDVTERPGARELQATGARITGEVRFESVEFRYDSDAPPTLKRIDLVVAPGSKTAIVGETGAGKTTLGYLVARLYDVTGGRVTIDGVDVRDLSFRSLARIVGLVSQETYLFHASIADNLRFARPQASDQELVEAARAARIHDLVAALPDGYDTVVGERGYRFSGGEKQRIAIARTILRNPPVLVLDEATSALDSETERAVQEALDRLAEGRTTIAIAHRLSTIRDADEIVVLHGGRIVERGGHDELMAAGGRYAALVAGSGPTALVEVG
ncbi:MAG TPA: ABC transporter ATP-binding protein [Solirubrobacteraceae bacterium]|nr:ABC transporter ATP-binding protein [Solirubrobacteraceae bacterium]